MNYHFPQSDTLRDRFPCIAVQMMDPVQSQIILRQLAEYMDATTEDIRKIPALGFPRAVEEISFFFLQGGAASPTKLTIFNSYAGTHIIIPIDPCTLSVGNTNFNNGEEIS